MIDEITQRPVKIGLLGASGRMGRAVTQVLGEYEADSKAAQLIAAIVSPTSQFLHKDAGLLAGIAKNGIMLSADIDSALAQCDVIIDFSTPKSAIDVALAMHNRYCQTLVTGTTGFSAAEEKALENASDSITLLKSGNFSLGITLLEALIEIAANRLDTGWDIEIVDMHHKHKVDAPSGTALMLGRAAAKGRGVSLEHVQCLSRQGQIGPRPKGEIGFAALRGGGVIGSHAVKIASDQEMISLSHDAFDRNVFAAGAVKSAIWAAKQPKGLYSMRDMLGL